MKRIRAIFLDAGHTLIHAHPSLGDVYADVTRQMGASVDPRQFEMLFVRTFASHVRGLSADRERVDGSDEQDRRMWEEITLEVYRRIPQLASLDFGKWFETLYAAFGRAESWRAYPGTEEVLIELRRRGYRLAIVSNWDTRLRKILDGMGMLKLVDHLIISSEIGCRKPDRRIFDRALSLAETAPGDAAHVGDSYDEDVVGARRAGVEPILIERQSASHPEGDGVAVIETLGELLERF